MLAHTHPLPPAHTLCALAQVQAFVQKGYAYAERTDAKGERGHAVGGGAQRQPLLGGCAEEPRVVRAWLAATCHTLCCSQCANSPRPPVCVSLAGDWFERTLGEVRKGAVRQLLEKPVWGMRRALASMDG